MHSLILMSALTLPACNGAGNVARGAGRVVAAPFVVTGRALFSHHHRRLAAEGYTFRQRTVVRGRHYPPGVTYYQNHPQPPAVYPSGQACNGSCGR